MSQWQENDILKIKKQSLYLPAPFSWGDLTWNFLEHCESRGQLKRVFDFVGVMGGEGPYCPLFFFAVGRDLKSEVS